MPQESIYLQLGDKINYTIHIDLNDGLGIFYLNLTWPVQVSELSDKIFSKWVSYFDNSLTVTKKIMARHIGRADNIVMEAGGMSVFPLFYQKDTKVLPIPEIKIHPRKRFIHKINDSTAQSRLPLPEGAKAQLGLRTMEFRELRDYQYGDSYKYINWQATARNITSEGIKPVVNEYERAGRKLVWIYLDTCRKMWRPYVSARRIDYASEVVTALVRMYLGNSCRVGYSSFGCDHFQLLPPKSSNKQLHKINDELLKLKPSQKSTSVVSLANAIQRSRAYFLGERPVSYVITFIDKDISELRGGLQKLVHHSGKPRTADGVILVELSPTTASTDEKIQEVVTSFQKIDHQIKLNKMGAGVKKISWDPHENKLTKIFAKLASTL